MKVLRSASIAILLAALVVVYHASMRVYLQDLDKPLILELGFLASLAIACSYEFRNVGSRYAAVGCIATCFVFGLSGFECVSR